MAAIEKREAKLFEATHVVAQFYDELECFMDILIDGMGRNDFGTFAERLHCGTFVHKNLPRRLLSAVTLVFFRGAVCGQGEEGEEEEVDRAENRTIAVTKDLKVPFATFWLFRPMSVPCIRTLESPRLLLGVLGNFSLVERRNRSRVLSKNVSLSLGNFVQLCPAPGNKAGDFLEARCVRPKTMQRYCLQAELRSIESHRLLELESHERVNALSRRLALLCAPGNRGPRKKGGLRIQ
jgi:hypothetical protein